MNYIKTEFKKLGSVILIGSGAFLLIEHTMTYSGIDLFDFLGHEILGIVLIVVGILTANRWGRLKFKEGLKHTLEKIKYIGGKKNGKNV